MRIGKYGKYKSKEYKVADEIAGNVELVSKDTEDLNNGFTRYERAPSIFIKTVRKEELEYFVKIIPYAIIDDEKFEIIGIGDNSVVIFTYDETIAKKHSMERTGIHEYKKNVSIKGLKTVEEKILLD